MEMMLNEPEFNPAMGIIEALTMLLVRVLAWLAAVLFGVTAEHEDIHVQRADAEPFDPSPSPCS